MISSCAWIQGMTHSLYQDFYLKETVKSGFRGDLKRTSRTCDVVVSVPRIIRLGFWRVKLRKLLPSTTRLSLHAAYTNTAKAKAQD